MSARYNERMAFLEFLVAGFFAFFVTRIFGALAEPSRERSRPRRRMVRCATCGVYVIEDRARAIGGGAFVCSAECADRL